MPPKESRHYKWKHIDFYAERGISTIIDEEVAATNPADPDTAVKRVRPGDFLKRAIAVRQATGDQYPDEARKASQLLEHAVKVCKIAKAQGDPGDPNVLEHIRKHKAKRSILLPHEVENILGPVGGSKFRVKMDNPRKMLLDGVQVVPDLTIMPGSPRSQ